MQGHVGAGQQLAAGGASPRIGGGAASGNRSRAEGKGAASGRRGLGCAGGRVVCDFDILFTFVVTGWLGSTHDTRIFLDSLITTRKTFRIHLRTIIILLILDFLTEKDV